METSTTNKVILPVAIVIAGALIAGAIFLGGKAPSKQSDTGVQPATPAQDITIAPVTDADHIIGSKDAKVILVEYSDLECPFCKQFHNTLHQIMNKYGTSTGQVAWVYRHFPIDQLHPKSRKESEATECATELGGDSMFWKYTDQVYSITPSNNNLDPLQLPKIAESLGLDVAKFNTCLSSGKYSAKVESQHADAIAAGGQGTPYTVILAGGKKIPITQGAIPFDALSSVIDQLLK